MLLIVLGLCNALSAQQRFGKDTAVLDINNWQATIKSGMSHGFGAMPRHKDSTQKPINPLFRWTLWCGGLDENKEIYAMAETYRQFDVSDNAVGPVTAQGNAVSDSVRAAYWDKVHKVSDWQVNHHLNGKTIDAVDNWPGNGDPGFDEPKQIAAFIDLDNDGVYEPSKGETPQMRGNQMLYTVNNDAAIKTVTGAGSMPLEVHSYTYGFNCKEGILQNTFFMDYYLINKSESDFDSFYVGIFTDLDLGKFNDDAIGSLVDKAFFSYNYDDSDVYYADSIPMISVFPVNEDLTKFLYYNNDFRVTGNPRNGTARDYYGYLSGRWKDGKCLQKGGNGYPWNGKTTCTDFMYDGNPFDTTSWSMTNEVSFGHDIRGVGSVNFGTFRSGDTIKITWAFSAHWKNHKDREKQYFNMIDDIDYIKDLYKNEGFESLCKTPLSIRKADKTEGLAVYPNPSTGIFTIDSKEQNDFDIYSSDGKLVKTLRVNEKTEFTLDAKGMYLIRNQSTGAQSTLIVL